MTKQSKDQMHPFLSKERSDVDKINDLWDIPSAGQGFLSQHRWKVASRPPPIAMAPKKWEGWIETFD